jgi:hypothetical protein
MGAMVVAIGVVLYQCENASFNRTKNFTQYDNISACIISGGRLPKE